MYPLFPGGGGYIVGGLGHGIGIEVDGYDVGLTALGGHEGYEACAGAHVEDVAAVLYPRPGSEQHTIGADLHGATVLADGKLLECECGLQNRTTAFRAAPSVDAVGVTKTSHPVRRCIARLV